MEKFKSGNIEIRHHSTSSTIEIKGLFPIQQEGGIFMNYNEFKDLVATIEKMKEEKHFLVTDKQY